MEILQFFFTTLLDLWIGEALLRLCQQFAVGLFLCHASDPLVGKGAMKSTIP
jgi:hypothetical protein